MKPVIYRSIWRSILKNCKRNMKRFDIKKGIITTGDNINTTHYLDRYYLSGSPFLKEKIQSYDLETQMELDDWVYDSSPPVSYLSFNVINSGIGINTEVFGPYENKGMNALSWIKHNIRVKEPTNDNINCLFEIHTDIEEIIGLAENGIIQSKEC